MMRIPFASPFALAFFLAISPAHAASPYEGRWAEDPAWCTRKGTDEMPIVITRRAIEQFASRCTVQSVRRKGAAWWLQTLCRDEGDDSAKRTPNTFVLRVDGDELAMRDFGGIRNFTRCPR
jgi:hypothetical protein